MTQNTSLSYRDAGVDIDAGDALVDRIKPLAVTSSRRTPVLPDVPGMGESGFAGADVDFYGCVGLADLARHSHELAQFGVRTFLNPDEIHPTGTIVILAEGEAPAPMHGLASTLDASHPIEGVVLRVDTGEHVGASHVACKLKAHAYGVLEGYAKDRGEVDVEEAAGAGGGRRPGRGRLTRPRDRRDVPDPGQSQSPAGRPVTSQRWCSTSCRK